MWTILWLTLISSLVINGVLFLIAYRLQSDKLTDISYALSFLTIAIVSLSYIGKYTALRLVIFSMAAIWALRIGGFLLMRIQQFGTDRRFDGVRENFLRFGKFWFGQALTAWVLMLPISIALYRGGRIGVLVLVGLLVWLAGLCIEAIADYQKFIFKLKKGKIDTWIATGIWKHARHPNYFGEILVWCGVYVSCFWSLNGLERLICLCSPVLIITLLLFVSGVPLLEKSADRRWGKLKTYQAYKDNTRLLIPLPK